ncbi:MAG: GWxTD domain-containing protein, partial [Candidatus Aminicenantes bacterium]|nr:GWxTD domain-containing protein [Candidatus Aminicenantes bacterium]
AVILLVLTVPLGILGQSKTALPERYKKWLDEEVVYIITAHERDVFLQLRTDRERDIFVEAYWKHRDPEPGTPRNEFEEEHYRRLNFANATYGRSSPLPGWRTDRGRIHILLGPPKNIEQYTNVNGVYPVEIWFYLGDPEVGLPTGFNVIFFKRNGTGDYILYSPAADGPRSLIADSMGGFQDTTRVSGRLSDDMAAYKALQELEPNLARQTLSLIPNEAVQPGNPSLASTRLMATIFASPLKKVEVGYADAILKYKDFIEVEYTANYISSEVQVQVIRDDAGMSLVHYTVEPAKISTEEIGGKYEVRFRLNGRISDAGGRTVYQFDKDFPFSMTAEELEEARAKSISIQDAFPLVPGTYTFDILLKNVLSKEFTGAGRTVVVPGPGGEVQLSPLLLAYGVEAKASPPGERVPFKAGDDQLLCQTRKAFSAKDSLVLFFQLYGLTEDLRTSGTLRTTFYREDKEFLSRTAKIAAGPAGTSIVDAQLLMDFPPGYYQVRVSLLDGQGREAAGAKENFEVSPATTVPRPFVVSKVVPSVKKEDDLFITGVQYMNKGDLEAAKTRLAEACGLDPRRADLAVAFSQALFRSNDFLRVKEILLPFAGETEPAAEIPALLGQASHALGEFQEAVTHYSAYLSRFGANIDILNYLGTCYYQLGNKEEAVKAWTKSLELSPNQEKIRALLESLKKK